MKERQLYDYQLDMKRRVDETFGSHRSVMVQMPTGTGKTCVLVACVREWLSQNEGTVWIVVHRRELVEQTVERFHELTFSQYPRSAEYLLAAREAVNRKIRELSKA